MKKYTIPQLYLSGFVKNFESKLGRYEMTQKRYKKGEQLTVPGIINNTAHFIHSGIIHLSLTHSSGNLKSMNFFGPQTIFPLGVVPHENLIDYEMILRAFTDVEVSSFSYPVLRQMCVDDGEMASQILEQNCEFIGYLFYQDMNHAYASTYVRVCDILHLYLENVKPLDNIIPMNQEELANLVGISRPQLERVLKDLRTNQVITTTRGSIQIINTTRLLDQCSHDIRRLHLR